MGEMIVVTGGAGFIGQNLVDELIILGKTNIIVIDNNIDRDFVKRDNITYMSVEDSYLWLNFNKNDIDVIFHLGARSDTTEMDENVFKRLNLDYSVFLWKLCSEADIRFYYASSAATYGDGEDGFDDNIDPEELLPLNPYGRYKNMFDIYVNRSKETPKHWGGFKFFNVYGYHEHHKGNMASVVWHFYHQIKETGEVKLFKSYNDDYGDGEQRRDFIYVDDVVGVMLFMDEYNIGVKSGIYNLGTGVSRTYNDLALAVFNSLCIEPKILYVDMPENFKDKYQYFTCATTDKMNTELFKPYFNVRNMFFSLEVGIKEYMKRLEDENC